MIKRFSLLIILLLAIIFDIQAVDLPKKEVRAVWLTTIYGLDWPSKPAKTPTEVKAQQEELIRILDRLEEANFNMIFLQTRVRGDVIYRSKIEPASKVFSGKYGVMTTYDPLAFAIEECHKRGMECHAWFVTFPIGTERIVKEQGNLSVVKKKPALCKRHNGEWYLDPGVPETSDYILSLVKEIVNGYDIDGIHFDYIRYPEQANKFPDKNVHAKYGKKQRLADWRRENINKMVFHIYDWVKSAKPWVQVSSSPLGKYGRIERVPNAGWTAYESVFQDPKKWLEMGKHDMIVPMMYYQHDNFFPFVDNWVENCGGRLVVPGLGAYRMMKEEGDWLVNDLTDQIDYSRYFGGAGVAFFRSANVTGNLKGLYGQLKDNYYKYPAQLPPLTWLSDHKPTTPEEIKVERVGDELKLSWNKPKDEAVPLTYTIYYSMSDSIDTNSPVNILMTGTRSTEVYLPVSPVGEKIFTFSVSASTRYRIEGDNSRETFYYWSEFPK